MEELMPAIALISIKKEKKQPNHVYVSANTHTHTQTILFFSFTYEMSNSKIRSTMLTRFCKENKGVPLFY